MNYENPDGPQNKKERIKNEQFWSEALGFEVSYPWNPDENYSFETELINNFLEKTTNPNIIEQDTPVVTPSQITSTHITLLPNYEDILKKSDMLKRQYTSSSELLATDIIDRITPDIIFGDLAFMKSIPNVVLTYENAPEWFDYNSERLLVEDWDTRKFQEQYAPIDIDFVKPMHFAKYMMI